MLRTAIKGLLARKLRLAMTALAVTLGVAFMAGTLVLTATVNKTFDDLFSDVYRGTDAVVRAQAVFDGLQGTDVQRGRVDASLVPALQRVPGVAAVEGNVFGYARLVGKDGKAIGNPASGAPTVGSNWSESKNLNPFTLAAGRGPRGDDEVVIDKKSSTEGGFSVGDTATVLVLGPPRQVRIVGIATFGAADSPGGASFVMFTTPVAQRLVAEPDKFDTISVVAAAGTSERQITSRIKGVLPRGVEALTGTAVTKETQDEIGKMLSFFSTFMLIFAAIALLVGGFMIFNTFSITVAQRTRENALLRALGASRRQVLASVLLEALVVGVLASLIGLVLGVGVAGGLKAMLDALGFDIPTGGVVFSANTAVVSIVAGVLVTLVAAVAPARKAAKIPPVAAMRGVAAGSSGYGSKERVIVGFLVLGLGVGALLVGLLSNVNNALAVVGLGALLVFFGVSVLGRTVSLPLSRALGAPLAPLRGITGELARENATRNPKRTAASASALMIGVGLVAFITIFASSTRASVTAAIDRAFTGDFVIDSGAGLAGGVDPGLAGRLNDLPEVQAAAGVRIGMAEVNGKVDLLAAADPATAFEIIDLQPVAGSTDDLGAGEIAVQQDVATSRHLAVGDTVPVVFKDSGSRDLRVAVIYAEDQPAGNRFRYFLGIDAYEANFANRYDTQVFIKQSPGVSSTTALAAIERVTDAYPGVKVLDQADYKREQVQPVNRMLSLVYAMLALAIVIALLGIGNTLALSIFERTRELGLLRAVGMTRSQLRSAIRWESVIIALQGTVLGLVIGLFFGWALVTALSDEGIDQFSVPVTSLIIVVMLAVIAGVAAAVLPGRRAAKLDVLKAVVTE